MQIQQLQQWYGKCNSKEICLSGRNTRVNKVKSSLLIKTLLQ